MCVNYRLNLFGFAASSDILQEQDPTNVQGLNFGLRDQKVALTWIARNVGAFGGNPDKVTLGGQSAGSFSVHAHLLEAGLCAERPLFRRAILQSGAMGTLGPDPLETLDKDWEALCRYWSVDGETAARRIDLLRRIPAESLVESAEKLRFDSFPAAIDNRTIRGGLPVNGDISVNLGPTDLRNGSGHSRQMRIDVLMGVTDWEVCHRYSKL